MTARAVGARGSTAPFAPLHRDRKRDTLYPTTRTYFPTRPNAIFLQRPNGTVFSSDHPTPAAPARRDWRARLGPSRHRRGARRQTGPGRIRREVVHLHFALRRPESPRHLGLET